MTEIINGVRYKSSWVLDASERYLPKCPTCGAWLGDPCRTPSYKSRKPHAAREALAAEQERAP